LERFQTWEITEGKMKGKLASFWILTFLFGCGLNTAGQGPDDDDQGPSDVPAEEAGPDIVEEDVSAPDSDDDRFELFSEDASLEVLDETSEIEETADETDSEEAEDAGPEDEASEEDGETEDGEITDPCAPPEIPTTGLYLWYCISEPASLDMAVERWVERLSGPPIVWAFEPGCYALDARSIFCLMADYGPGSTYYFNITTPTFGAGWSCGPDLEVNHGVPHIWHDGRELEVSVVDNGYGGCNHSFEITPL
jgi:hypothetical protein